MLGKRGVRKVLVIGGAGYLGSVLVRHLLERRYRVRVLDRFLFGHESLAELDVHSGFERVEGDFRDLECVAEAARGVQAAIHLGAIVGDRACAVDEQATLETNYAATALVADVCKSLRIPRLVFASTCSVYGASDRVVDETSSLNPLSHYAATKADAEKALLESRDGNFHPTILRLGTAFGWSPRPRFDLVVNLLTAKACCDREIVIYNEDQWRPFVHVRDIARACRLALEAPLSSVSGQTFNVGSCHMNHRLGEVAATLQQSSPDLKVVYESNGDARNYRVSFEKIRRMLGFECRTSLPVGIGEIRGALAQGRVLDYRLPIYHNDKQLLRGSDLLPEKPFSLDLGRDQRVGQVTPPPAIAPA